MCSDGDQVIVYKASYSYHYLSGPMLMFTLSLFNIDSVTWIVEAFLYRMFQRVHGKN